MRDLLLSRTGLMLSLTLTLTLSLTLGLTFNLIQINAPQALDDIASSVHWGVKDSLAKKKRKRKRREYDRVQREVQRLLDAGHPSVTITIKTRPRVRARVYHGKEKLGVTPLQLTWTKDTGPIDLTLKASGYITLNSRFYTYRDDRVTINMFKANEAHLLFGYKKKVKSKEEVEDEGGEP